MPPPTPLCKPPTAPCAAIDAMLPFLNEPPDYVALCNGAVKQNGAGVIIAILHYPPFTSAIVGTWSMAQMLPSSANWAHYLGLLNLTFSDQADFACITDQSGFPSLLSDALQLPSSAWDVSAGAKAFHSFANAIVAIDHNRQELCCKHEAKAVHKCHAQDHNMAMAGLSPTPSAKCKANTELDGKHKPKKIKVTLLVANYKSGSETALLLLGQVDATLKAVSLADGDESVPHEDLKKQCRAVELAAQQQLHLLDLSLQTYKLIATHFAHLDKALASPDIDLAGLLLNALNVSFESTPEESDVKLATSPIDEPKSSLELLLTPAL
ncbi:hypothetical protein J132_10221 [Termitomyces sp. J132]|nr:hypothetical protein J132_10221 [Termitomyces sp. J132]